MKQKAEVLLIGSLRSHDGNGNCNANLLLFQNFGFKRLLTFRSNLLPLRGSEVVHFTFIIWLGNRISGVLYCRSGPAKQNSVVLNVCCQRKEYRLQASLSYKGPHFGLFDDISKVACGNKTCFAEFQVMFWLALPTGFLKLSVVDQLHALHCRDME